MVKVEVETMIESVEHNEQYNFVKLIGDGFEFIKFKANEKDKQIQVFDDVKITGTLNLSKYFSKKYNQEMIENQMYVSEIIKIG